jgi:hypothetical protein
MIGPFKWQAGPAVAESLGMTTETLYPWLDAMGVQRIQVVHRTILVDTHALLEALDLWARAESGGELTPEEIERITATWKSRNVKRGAMERAMLHKRYGDYIQRIRTIAERVDEMSEDELKSEWKKFQDSVNKSKKGDH